MTWFKVDDGLCTHPKPRAAGLAAMGLWAVAGSYCGQQLTDGFVPDWYVQSWPQGKKHADALVRAGLWTRVEVPEPGWQFHEWEQSNPTREQEMDRRAKAAQRQADYLARRAAKDQEDGNVTPLKAKGKTRD